MAAAPLLERFAPVGTEGIQPVDAVPGTYLLGDEALPQLLLPAVGDQFLGQLGWYDHDTVRVTDDQVAGLHQGAAATPLRNPRKENPHEVPQ